MLVKGATARREPMLTYCQFVFNEMKILSGYTLSIHMILVSVSRWYLDSLSHFQVYGWHHLEGEFRRWGALQSPHGQPDGVCFLWCWWVMTRQGHISLLPQRCLKLHEPLARYVKLRVAHALGIPGMFPPSPRVSDPDMHHGTCVMHVPWCMPVSLSSGFFWSRRRVETFPAFPAHAQPVILRIWYESPW